MSKKANKQKDAQTTYWNTAAQQAQQNITKVDPLEQRLRDNSAKFLDWESSAGKNVEDAPGLDNYIQIGRGAMARANQERMGDGALQLGDESSGNANYLANLKSLRQNEMGQNFGAGLEDALSMRRAEATGSIMPLAQMAMNKNIASAGAAQGMAQNWMSKPKEMTWFDRMLQVGNMASGFFSPISFGGGGGGGSSGGSH